MYMYIGHLSVCVQYVHVYRHMYVIVIAQGQGFTAESEGVSRGQGWFTLPLLPRVQKNGV